MQFYRKAQMSKNPFLHKMYKKLFEISTKKKGIEFSVDNEIGYGFYVDIHMESQLMRKR